MIVGQERLAFLANPEPLAGQLDHWGAERGWWSAGLPWKRAYGRVEYGHQPWSTLVYESSLNQTGRQTQQLCMVEIFDAQPLYGASAQLCARHEVLGWVRLSRFPADPALPTLRQVLQNSAQAHIVRYRPGRRCTLKAQDPQDGAIRFAKVFPDQRGEWIHRDSEMLWQASTELGFRVAPPGRWDSAKLTLWQGQIPGQPVRSKLYGLQGQTLAERIGRAAGTLVRSSLQPSARFDGRDQLKRSACYVRRLQEIDPALSVFTTELMQTLQEIHKDCADTQLKPIHGALHVHQWLDDGECLGLVDFDRFCLGDPENDAATFIAELDYENPAKVPVHQLSEAFLEGYQAIVGRLNQRLLQAYRAHKHLSKALKAARALRTDGLQRAERNLQRALHHTVSTLLH